MKFLHQSIEAKKKETLLEKTKSFKKEDAKKDDKKDAGTTASK